MAVMLIALMNSCFPKTGNFAQNQSSKEEELSCSIIVYDLKGDEEIQFTSYERSSLRDAQIIINKWYFFRPAGGTMRMLSPRETYIFSAYAFYDPDLGKKFDPTKERIREVEVKAGNKSKHIFNDLRFSIRKIEALCNDAISIEVDFILEYRNPEEETQLSEQKQDITDFLLNEMKSRPSTDFDNYGLKIRKELLENINHKFFNDSDIVKDILIHKI
jgi:hypothetical protein